MSIARVLAGEVFHVGEARRRVAGRCNRKGQLAPKRRVPQPLARQVAMPTLALI